jgi:hypothetical protein
LASDISPEARLLVYAPNLLKRSHAPMPGGANGRLSCSTVMQEPSQPTNTCRTTPAPLLLLLLLAGTPGLAVVLLVVLLLPMLAPAMEVEAAVSWLYELYRLLASSTLLVLVLLLVVVLLLI